MQGKSATTIIKLVGILEIFGGIVCFVGLIILYKYGDLRSTNNDLITVDQLLKLRVYYWISLALSFILSFGILRLKEWSRKLLLIFTFFGLLNAIIKVFPPLAALLILYFPAVKYHHIASCKNFVFLLTDCFIILFFMHPSIKKLFR